MAHLGEGTSTQHEQMQMSHTTLSFADEALKKARADVINKNEKSNYINLPFIFPASNFCERLVSLTWYALGDHHKRVLPSNFECQLFLNLKHRIWGLKEVSKLLREKEKQF